MGPTFPWGLGLREAPALVQRPRVEGPAQSGSGRCSCGPVGRPRGRCVPDSHGPPGRGPTAHEGGLGGRRCGFCWFKWEGQPFKDRESPRCQPCSTGTQPSLGCHCCTPLPNKDTTRIPRRQRQGRDAHGPSALCTAHSLGTLGGLLAGRAHTCIASPTLGAGSHLPWQHAAWTSVRPSEPTCPSIQIRLGAGCCRTQLPILHQPPAPALPICPDALLCYKPQTKTRL